MSAKDLTPKSQKLLDLFRRQRVKADAALDKLDATAHELALSLADDGLTLREAAPLMSAEGYALSHMMVAYALKCHQSRRPWRGNTGKRGARG